MKKKTFNQSILGEKEQKNDINLARLQTFYIVFLLTLIFKIWGKCMSVIYVGALHTFICCLPVLNPYKVHIFKWSPFMWHKKNRKYFYLIYLSAFYWFPMKGVKCSVHKMRSSPRLFVVSVIFISYVLHLFQFILKFIKLNALKSTICQLQFL